MIVLRSFISSNTYLFRSFAWNSVMSLLSLAFNPAQVLNKRFVFSGENHFRGFSLNF